MLSSSRSRTADAFCGESRATRAKISSNADEASLVIRTF
jgi:hypothetical protein